RRAGPGLAVRCPPARVARDSRPAGAAARGLAHDVRPLRVRGERRPGGAPAARSPGIARTARRAPAPGHPPAPDRGAGARGRHRAAGAAMSRGHAALLPVAVLLAGAALAGTPPPAAVFEWFEYSGHDDVFDEPLADAGYRNPIVAGFFPDPSITRRGDDWYMVHSSFAYTPGLPVLHSRNLVHWPLVGHSLPPSQPVPLTG